MSNKTQLQTNNTTLDGYIARINAAKEVAAGLPEAGGSIISESCEVSLETAGIAPETPTIYYVSPDMTLEHFNFSPGGGDIIAIAKNSIVYLADWTNYSYASEGASLINYNTGDAAYFISGDCTLTYSA